MIFIVIRFVQLSILCLVKEKKKKLITLLHVITFHVMHTYNISSKRTNVTSDKLEMMVNSDNCQMQKLHTIFQKGLDWFRRVLGLICASEVNKLKQIYIILFKTLQWTYFLAGSPVLYANFDFKFWVFKTSMIIIDNKIKIYSFITSISI